jgi:hypothetical protein
MRGPTFGGLFQAPTVLRSPRDKGPYFRGLGVLRFEVLLYEGPYLGVFDYEILNVWGFIWGSLASKFKGK